MEQIDPHTLQQILDKIEQQMRCPQCGKKVPLNFESVKVITDGAMLLQLKCDHCNAFIVLQASLTGVDQISAPAYEEDKLANKSSELILSKEEIVSIDKSLAEADGSFISLFGEQKPVEEVEQDLSETDWV